MRKIRIIASWLLLVICLLTGCSSVLEQTNGISTGQDKAEYSREVTVREDGTYTSKEEVALYLHTYNKLPSNFITKTEAKKMGWNSKQGNLEKIAPGKSIGGDRFGNYEGQLPEERGRKYYECDIGYNGGYRGTERLIYSNDGMIYYTDDHYRTFEQLYGG